MVVMEMVRPDESVAVMLEVPLSNSSATLCVESEITAVEHIGNIRNRPTWGACSSRALWSHSHRSSLP